MLLQANKRVAGFILHGLMEAYDQYATRRTGRGQLKMYTNVLMLEYGNIANIVRQSPAMRTPQMSSNLMKLVLDSLDHAEFVIHLLKDAGVEPSVVWTFPGKTMLAKSYGVNWKPSVLWPGLIGR